MRTTQGSTQPDRHTDLVAVGPRLQYKYSGCPRSYVSTFFMIDRQRDLMKLKIKLRMARAMTNRLVVEVRLAGAERAPNI